ncbi:hypothetical protein GCM10008935_21730 [Alkalibacillus silvisoli]|uniref:CXXC-20-CXXC protein n=1 Tax=Alkalibacillus silvisoli TaxID=392823 RepID=A0ABN1A1Z1_9BACI
MPICQQCETKWSWWETNKVSTKLDTRMVCLHCHAHQYASKKTLKVTGGLTLLIPFIIIVPSMIFKMTLLDAIGLSLAVILSFSIVYPFILKLSSTEEHLVNWGKMK